MAAVADINAKLDQLQTTQNATLAAVQALPPSVATQADLDAIAAKVDANQATADQIAGALPKS